MLLTMEVNEGNPEMLKYSLISIVKPKGCCSYPLTIQARLLPPWKLSLKCHFLLTVAFFLSFFFFFKSDVKRVSRAFAVTSSCPRLIPSCLTQVSVLAFCFNKSESCKHFAMPTFNRKSTWICIIQPF